MHPLTTATLAMLTPTNMMFMMFVLLLMFGAKKLPELARGLGQAMKEFSEATNEIHKAGLPPDVFFIAVLYVLLVVTYLVAVETEKDVWFIATYGLLLADFLVCLRFRRVSKFARVSSTICLGLMVWMLVVYFAWRGFRDGSR